MEAVTLGVGVRHRRSRELADARGEAGEQARQLAAAGAEVPGERPGLRVGDKVLERGRERPVGRSDDRVAVPVEDDDALVRDRARELADEAALAGAGVAGDERRAPPLPHRPRQQRTQRRELVCPSGERVRRREPERAG